MKNLRYLICLIAVSVFCLNLSAQDVSQITYLSELDNKTTATYGDALIMFNLQSGKSSSAKTGSKAAPFALNGYTEAAPLTKGMASLMAAKYLDLDQCFMYKIFKTERYAYKACVANELFTANGSENDKISGPELLELLSLISERGGDK